LDPENVAFGKEEELADEDGNNCRSSIYKKHLDEVVENSVQLDEPQIIAAVTRA
jgi:hypothetical protein